MLNSKEILELLQNSPQGYLKPDHILFTASNSNLLQTYKKLGAINSQEEQIFTESLKDSTNQIFCNVFGCSMVFDNIASYQIHYNVMHRFICAECKKSLPTEHLLDLHISEHHDSYFMARRERGECLFKCYLEECGEVLRNSHERRDHCIKNHRFPKNFRFDQKCSIHKEPNFNRKTEHVEMEVEELTPTSSKNQGLKMFSFGHQKEKTFYPRNSQRQTRSTDKSLEDMNSLKQALE